MIFQFWCFTFGIILWETEIICSAEKYMKVPFIRSLKND